MLVEYPKGVKQKSVLTRKEREDISTWTVLDVDDRRELPTWNNIVHVIAIICY